jgi:raffinose/stachyose/melibiose transport system permease protein
MLPLVKTMAALHLMNQGGLVILYITLALCQGVFLCVGYLKSIPFDLEEMAFIDGCSVWVAFLRIIYPLMFPILVTVMIMNALWIWNDFLLPLVILNKTQAYWTLPLFQFNFKGQYSFDYNLAFASFFLSMLPIVILYAIFQKYIIGGLTEGSVKS